MSMFCFDVGGNFGRGQQFPSQGSTCFAALKYHSQGLRGACQGLRGAYQGLRKIYHGLDVSFRTKPDKFNRRFVNLLVGWPGPARSPTSDVAWKKDNDKFRAGDCERCEGRGCRYLFVRSVTRKMNIRRNTIPYCPYKVLKY